MSRKPAEVASKERNECVISLLSTLGIMLTQARYIPNFISKKPFYLEGDDTQSDYLEHQRLQTSTPDQSKWYDRGKRAGPAATKFRRGACENCGAMTHNSKECLSRPRAKGARWTGRDIQADEVVQDVHLGWDAKRDRWNGYDAMEYRNVIEEYEELENLKKKAKGESGRGETQQLITEGEEGTQGGAEEEAKYAEESEMGREQSTATRNLRIREDTAKYLLNLDLDSAKYDPKTRSMVDMGAQADQAAALVAEDNFMKASGDAAEFERAQKYAWEIQERGDKHKLHLQANPTSGEYFRRKEREENQAKQNTHREKLLQKYGGEEHLQISQSEVGVVENERYVEYDPSGAIKGARKAEAKSKYSEDVLINNHTSVWGSWWANFGWGYACCHSTVKNSYCTGEEGKLAFEAAEHMRTSGGLDSQSRTRAKDGNNGTDPAINQIKEDPESGRLIKREHRLENLARKRTLTEMKDGVSEEELEAYRRSRTAADDPMAKFIGKDELVH